MAFCFANTTRTYSCEWKCTTFNAIAEWKIWMIKRKSEFKFMQNRRVEKFHNKAFFHYYSGRRRSGGFLGEKKFMKNEARKKWAFSSLIHNHNQIIALVGKKKNPYRKLRKHTKTFIWQNMKPKSSFHHRQLYCLWLSQHHQINEKKMMTKNCGSIHKRQMPIHLFLFSHFFGDLIVASFPCAATTVRKGTNAKNKK